jgi:iron-sulfur cluster assembly protein
MASGLNRAGRLAEIFRTTRRLPSGGGVTSPEFVDPDPEESLMLTLSESAADVIRELSSQPGMPADAGLRIEPNALDTGGPSFAVSVSAGPMPQDRVVESGQARVFLEPHVVALLDDKVLDADVDQQGAVAFHVSPQSPDLS